MIMKIAIGSDHAGFEAKELLIRALKDEHDITDCGTESSDSVDYPDVAEKVSRLVSTGKAERGILICGTGIGMSISANKIRGIRAAVCHNEESAKTSRLHNDANVLCMGARLLSKKQIIHIAEAWLSTDFEGGRHSRRVEKMMRLEG